MHYLSLRFWIGAWIFLYLVFIVALDLSSLVRFITRFTEESFAVLISVIFLYESFSKIGETWTDHTVHVGRVREPPGNFTCHCLSLFPQNDFNLTTFASLNISSNGAFIEMTNGLRMYIPEDCITHRHRVEVRHGCVTRSTCSNVFGWVLEGNGCVPSVTDSVPDVFLLTCLLIFGTFAVAIFFRNMKTTRYFPTQVHQSLRLHY